MSIQIFNGKPFARPERLTAKEKATKRIVVGDDEKIARIPVVESLRSDGYEIIHEAETLEQLDRIVEKSEPDLVLLDLDWGKGPHQGLEAMKSFEERRIPTNYIIVSGQSDEDVLL
jgi:DNA-binding NarL/FixJ family response regulator